MKAILAALLFGFAGMEVARACSCLPPPPAPEKRAGATAVFVGRVVGLTEQDGRRTYAFAVSDVFKGAIGESAAVSSRGDSAMCGSYFQHGVTYLIYANGPIDRLSTNLCNANLDASSPQAQLEIETLRTLGREVSTAPAHMTPSTILR